MQGPPKDGGASGRLDRQNVGMSPRRRPSPFTVIGIVMLVVGLSCLGWVGYQYFGTNVVSEKAFEQEKDGLRAKWDSQPAGEDDPDAAQVAIPGDAIGLLRIPAFGKDYEIPILSGTDLSILSRGVGHYTSTAAPGEVGNFAIAGHRITHGEPFAKLLDLNVGDTVVVETREAVYTYAIEVAPKTLTVPDTETCVIDPVPCHSSEKADTEKKGEASTDAAPTEKMLTLTTCQDLFRSPDRSVGYAVLEKTQEKSGR